MSLVEWYYKKFVRPKIFEGSRDDAELAHEWGLEKLNELQNSRFKTALARAAFTYYHPMLETTVMGLDFPNPFGLAAGFDKYCEVYHTAIPACGWGFVEVGGITMLEQPGNDRPRMKRSEAHEALWNFMGFNNPGADGARETFNTNPTCPVPILLNVGKSKNTPLGRAAEDYCYTVSKLWPFVQMITLNPSSPNTPGLRTLQNKENLQALVSAVSGENVKQARLEKEPRHPLGVKISPDESDEQLADIVEVCVNCSVDYIIATNTTVGRKNVRGWNIPSHGGVSGKPLRDGSMRVLGEVYRALREKKSNMALIGVGGIKSGDDLYYRIREGATLCQAYTAWPFEGPDFVRRCLKRLVQNLKADGFAHVSEAIGSRWK